MPTEAKEYKQPYIENIDVAGIIQGGEEIQTTSGAILPSQGSTTEEGRGLPLGEFTELTVGAGDKIFRVSKKGLWLGAPAFDNAPFKVTPAGVLNASNATLSGSITATSGAIGGFAIGATTLTGGTTNIILDSSNKAISINSATFGNKGIQLEYNSGTPRTYIGDGANQYFKFSGTKTSFKGTNAELTEAGVFTASNAVITGTITATSGKIANWFINTNSIADNQTEANAKVLIDSANTLIRLGPTSGNYITLDGANQRIRSSNYVSGPLGAGFTLEPDLLEVGNIRARGKITSTAFEYEKISAIGGEFVVSQSDTLAQDTGTQDALTLVTDGSTQFAVNDIIRLKEGTTEEYMRVSAVTDISHYTVVRDLAGDFSANENPNWTKGATIVKVGSSNLTDSYSGGWLFAKGAGTNAPYWSVVKRTGVAYDAFTEYTRFGNLKGFLDYNEETYGIAIGDSFKYFTYDPSNGIRMRSTKENRVIEISSDPLKIRFNDGTYDRVLIGETEEDTYGIKMGDNTRYFTYDTSNGIKLRSTKGDYIIEISTDPLKIRLNDGSYDRIVIGETADDVYGIEIRSPSGVSMFDIDNNNQRISTADGKTYWDLGAGRFVVNDGITDRILIGNLG